MKTHHAQTVAVSTVGPTHYTGPLDRFIQQQAEVKASVAALQSMRINILDMVADPHLFSKAEREAATINVQQCYSLAMLQRWFCNVYGVMKERETSLRIAIADGFYTHIPVDQPASFLPVMWIA